MVASPSATNPGLKLLEIGPMHPLLQDSPTKPEVGELKTVHRSSLANKLEIEGLKRHGLHLFYIIDPGDFGERDPKEIVQALLENPSVELAYEAPALVPAYTTPKEPEFGTVPSKPSSGYDYTDCRANSDCQRYMLGPNEVGNFKIGGVNAFEAQRITSNLGEGVRILQMENGHPEWTHEDLPDPWLVIKAVDMDDHSTMSAGLMWGQDNGFGVKGVTPKAKAGYTVTDYAMLLSLRDYLQAGDVVQLGIQGALTGQRCSVQGVPESTCFLPIEYDEFMHSSIKYLVEEKGVHVIMAAGNGQMDIDHASLEGQFSRTKDSGAIIVGAVNPETGIRAFYSSYGSRVDLFSWGYHVTTTYWRNSYTTTYSGTSSANPIIAGCVAFIQSVAYERGLGNLPPKVLRQILFDSGQDVPFDDGKYIGRQPDLVKALELLGGSGGTTATTTTTTGTTSTATTSTATTSTATTSTGTTSTRTATTVIETNGIATTGAATAETITTVSATTGTTVKTEIQQVSGNGESKLPIGKLIGASLVGVVVCAAVGGIGWLGYKLFFAKESQPTEETYDDGEYDGDDDGENLLARDE